MPVKLFLVTIAPSLLTIGFILEVIAAIFLYKPQLFGNVIENPDKKGFVLLLIGLLLQLIAMVIQNLIGLSFGNILIMGGEISIK